MTYALKFYILNAEYTLLVGNTVMLVFIILVHGE